MNEVTFAPTGIFPNGAKIVADFNFMTKDAWEEARQTHYGLHHYTLGGSDAGVVMGVNKWKDVAQLYLEKTGEVIIPVDNEAVEWGNRLESVIAEKFKDTNREYDVIPFNYLIQSPDHPFMVANIDRLLYDPETGEYGILEIKTASEYVKGDWDNGNIPPSYYAQIQHYLAVTGLEFAYFAVLIGGNKYHQVHVLRNDEYIKALLFQEEMFILRLDMKQLPELTGSDSSAQVVNFLFPKATEEKKVLKLGEDHAQMIAERQALKEEIKMLEEQAKELDNKLKATLGEMKKGACEFNGFKYSISWGNTAGRTKFNDKKFKEDYPDIYQQYVETGEDYRTFRVTTKEL